MSSTAQHSQFISNSPIARLFADIRRGNAALWVSTVGMALGAIVCSGLMAFDTRGFNGIDVWDKPAKFFLSLAVQYATVSFALSLIPSSRGTRIAVWLMIAAGWGEVAYIVYRAALAEASHFNSSSIAAQVAYGLMGFGALTLTATAFFIGWRVWRVRGQSLITEATSLGLMLGMAVGMAAGVYMSAQTSHWVGGELSDAHGLGFFSWSTTGGDLRVAHFIGLHAAQIIPLAALSGDKRMVYAVAGLSVAFTAATFVLALMGIPLLRG